MNRALDSRFGPDEETTGPMAPNLEQHLLGTDGEPGSVKEESSPRFHVAQLWRLSSELFSLY